MKKRKPLIPPSPVAILVGSDSDLKIMKEAADIFQDFKVLCSVHIKSAHRTPEQVIEFAKTVHENGVKVIIAAAGGAAHLAGVLAAHIPDLPIIAVPICQKVSSGISGTDSLLSTVQMPPGIPVATVGINAAKNAALLALQILSHSAEHSDLSGKLVAYREELSQAVIEKDESLQEFGLEEFLKETAAKLQ